VIIVVNNVKTVGESADKAGNQEYIFVVRNMGVVKQIAEFNPNMPNKIGLNRLK
jgi:hypothetical protein